MYSIFESLGYSWCLCIILMIVFSVLPVYLDHLRKVIPIGKYKLTHMYCDSYLTILIQIDTILTNKRCTLNVFTNALN